MAAAARHACGARQAGVVHLAGRRHAEDVRGEADAADAKKAAALAEAKKAVKVAEATGSAAQKLKANAQLAALEGELVTGLKPMVIGRGRRGSGGRGRGRGRGRA